MIGLGSNRLTIARRGGMSVTQAGRGGMEWLAGGRMPSWASPYSAQATAALKAQFPTQWPTIRDYGFAHPEIVGYMNAYAPEDAKIAYSLVAGLGIRTALNDAGCYARFPNYHSTQDTFIRIRTKVVQATGIYPLMIRFGKPYDKMKCFWLSNATSIGFAYGGTEYLGIASFDSNTHTFEMIYNNFYIDGVLKMTATPKTFENTNPTGGVTICASDDGNRKNREQIEFVEYGEGDGSVSSHYIVPYIRNGVSGLLDIKTGDFSEILGSGSFTISETPA